MDIPYFHVGLYNAARTIGFLMYSTLYISSHNCHNASYTSHYSLTPERYGCMQWNKMDIGLP